MTPAQRLATLRALGEALGCAEDVVTNLSGEQGDRVPGDMGQTRARRAMMVVCSAPWQASLALTRRIDADLTKLGVPL